MVHLVSVHHAFHARVLVARLGSDGIVTELRGLVEGPYPVSGEIQVFVEPDDLPVARELLLADEVESCFEEADEAAASPIGGRPPGGAWASARRWVALVGLALVIVIVGLAGLLRLG